MSVMTSFTRRSLVKNRMRTVVSIIGIALSVALITAIWTTVASLQQGLYQRTIATEGWWQVYLQGAADDTVAALRQSDNVTDAAVSRDGGVALFAADERETLGPGIIVKSLPEAAKGQVDRDGMPITCLPEVTEGRAPEAAGEIMLPRRLRGTALGEGAGDGAPGSADAAAGAAADAGGVSTDGPLALGSSVSLDVCRYVSADPDERGIVSTVGAVQQLLDGASVADDQGNPVEGYGGALVDAGASDSDGAGADDAASGYGDAAHVTPLRLVAREAMTFVVVGFYDDLGAKFVGNDFTASGIGASFGITAPGGFGMVAGPDGVAAADNALSGLYIDVWASTQGFSSVSELTEFTSGLPGGSQGLAHNSLCVYTHNNLVRYQGISSGSLLQDTLTAMAGVLALVVAAASVSLIYNSFSISVAERTRQFGLLASLGASKRQLRRSVLVEALLLGAVGIPCGMLLGIGGTAAVLGLTGAGFSALLGVGEGLSLAVEPVSLIVSAVLSLITLLVSAWIPALRAGRVSAVDAIRQVQDVKLPRRAERRLAKARARAAGSGAAAAGSDAAAAVSAPVPFSKRGDRGLWGAVAGVPGILAHRSLSRQSARGRIVVASLAVSVVLVVTAGAVALTMDPIANRAASAAGASADADVTMMASSSDVRNDDLYLQAGSFDRLVAEASQLDGMRLAGSVRQGGMEVRIPSGMLSDAGRAAIQDAHDQTSMDWVPQPFGQDGAYYGQADVFYLDAASFAQLADSLGVGDLDFADPAHPRAIALNTYQGVSSDAAYVYVEPFAQTGAISAYYGASVPQGYSSMGVVEGADGGAALGLLDRSTAEAAAPTIERVPLGAGARSVQIDVVALAPDAPGMANVMSASRSLPVLLLSGGIASAAETAAQEGGSAEASAAGSLSATQDDAADALSDANGEQSAAHARSAIEADTPFSYSWANAAFEADDPARATEQLQELAGGYSELTVNVIDLASEAEQSRLAAQTIQVFILCFTVIMALIAVANVFNTLTNSIILRTREFAVLKSVGMGDRAFARMLVCECASYALRGLVAGLVLAVLVAWALYQALGIAFRGVDFSLPWPYVGAAVALVLVVLAISVAFALRKSHAANVVEALRADAV